MAGSLSVPSSPPTPLAQQGARGGLAYRSASSAGALAGSYATVEDLVVLSIPQDSRHDFAEGAMVRHLQLGSRRVDEWLGQRFQVPLAQWSETVVWAACELAYCSLYRQRGGNTEGDWQSFRDREAAVREWCRAARDHEVTPDARLSDADIPQQAVRYLGDPLRGWDQPEGYGRGTRRGF